MKAHNQVGRPTLIYTSRRRDDWIGTAEELIAAGLVVRSMIPGEPGNNKVCTTFYGGRPIRQGQNVPHDENYLQIKREGKQRFVVQKGVSEEESRRRETRLRLHQRLPDQDVDSLEPPRFYIGEKVAVSRSWIGAVTDVSFNDEGYAYKVEPSRDAEYEWFAEFFLTKCLKDEVAVIKLPNAAASPVKQLPRKGRLPKEIGSLRDARFNRDCREYEINKLYKKLRDLHQVLDVFQACAAAKKNEIAEVKGQLDELFN